MGMNALTIDSARVRAGSWRGSDDLAYLVPLSGASTLTPSTLERIRAHLREDGFRSVVTAAVGPSERDMLAADGFTEYEALHLLRHDLQGPLPERPRRAQGLRRGRRRNVDAILDVDRQTMMHNEAVAVELNNSSEDCQEGIASFRERRDPVWKGY